MTTNVKLRARTWNLELHFHRSVTGTIKVVLKVIKENKRYFKKLSRNQFSDFNSLFLMPSWRAIFQSAGVAGTWNNCRPLEIKVTFKYLALGAVQNLRPVGLLGVELLLGSIFGFLLLWSVGVFDFLCLFLPWSVAMRPFFSTLVHRGIPLLVNAEVEVFPVVPGKVKVVRYCARWDQEIKCLKSESFYLISCFFSKCFLNSALDRNLLPLLSKR